MQELSRNQSGQVHVEEQYCCVGGVTKLSQGKLVFRSRALHGEHSLKGERLFFLSSMCLKVKQARERITSGRVSDGQR